MVNVTAARLFRLQLPLKGAIEHAGAKRRATDNIVLELELSDGTRGYGEAVPRSFVTGETVEACWRILTDATQRLLGAAAHDLDAAVAVAEQQTAAIADADGVVHNNARAAIEIALLDAFSRSTRTPWSRCLAERAGGTPGAGKPLRYSLVCMRALLDDPELLRAALARHRYRAAKIKVGFGFDRDVASVARVRELMGPDAELRLDANSSFGLDQAIALLGAVRAYGVRVIEDPLGGTLDEQADGLRRLRREESAFVILDERVRTADEARHAIALGAADAFNLRVAKCGGLLRATEMAQLSRAAGLRVQVGCQVGETAILSAAGRHLATAIGDAAYLEGSNEQMKFAPEHFVSVEDLTYDEDAVGRRLEGDGLGISVDRDRLVGLASVRHEARGGAT